MNRDLLEQLLMDQALNELTPESTVLLDAYLSDHPELQSLADSIKETVDLGEKAVQTELPELLPPLKKETLLKGNRKTSWSSMRHWLSVAASLIIGFGLGTSTILLQDTPHITYSEPVASNFQSQPVEGGFEAARAFWSSKTYIDRYQQMRKEFDQERQSTHVQEQIRKLKKRGLL